MLHSILEHVQIVHASAADSSASSPKNCTKFAAINNLFCSVKFLSYLMPPLILFVLLHMN